MLQVMGEAKYMVLMDQTIHTLKEMFMIGTEEYNKESTRINAASMIYDRNKEFRFNFFVE